MTKNVSHAEIKSLVLEYLKDKGHQRSQVGIVVNDISPMAQRRYGIDDRYVSYYLPSQVEDVMWELFRLGILFPGLDQHNRGWPWYHLSEHGIKIVESSIDAQPYDPDGFIKAFKIKHPVVDSLILEYFTEAVQCFNAATYRAAAVMLGAASEQAILLLVDAFEIAIVDPTKKQQFEKDKERTIYRHFVALQDRLEKMKSKKMFPQDLSESIASELRGCFDLLRRSRNEAGHPASAGVIEPDSAFINLRLFPIYIERVYRFINYFKVNPANW